MSRDAIVRAHGNNNHESAAEMTAPNNFNASQTS